jgi:hypothetical protein
LVAELPPGVSFDLAQPAPQLIKSIEALTARYAPECLSSCEMSVYCRSEAAGTTGALGRPVRDALGGVESIEEALALADGVREPAEGQAEAAALLRAARRLRDEALS